MTLLEWDDNIIGDKLMYERAKTANTKTNPDPTIIKIEQEIAEILGHYSGNEPYVFPILEPGLPERLARASRTGTPDSIFSAIGSVWLPFATTHQSAATRRQLYAM